MKRVFASCFFVLLFVSIAIAQGVLFDAGHGQTAGNADWIINGAYSDFAKSVGLFFTVDQTTSLLNANLLQRYNVLVIPEPNDPFTWDEQQSIIEFIKNGGGVFFIADHEGADRNGNGWDAVDIFDEFVQVLGFEFEKDNMSEYPIDDILNSPISSGVSTVGEWAGSTIKILGDNVKPAVELSTHQIYAAYGYYGKGRFVAVGDSSIFDDGSGTPGKILYDGWQSGSDSIFGLDAVYWLATGTSTNTSKYLLPPKVVGVTVESSDTVKVVFDKTIKGTVVPRINVAIIGEKIDEITVAGSSVILKVSPDLKVGTYTLITRAISDVYNNLSPIDKITFNYAM
jgi:hypothetical protein